MNCSIGKTDVPLRIELHMKISRKESIVTHSQKNEFVQKVKNLKYDQGNTKRVPMSKRPYNQLLGGVEQGDSFRQEELEVSPPPSIVEG